MLSSVINCTVDIANPQNPHRCYLINQQETHTTLLWVIVAFGNYFLWQGRTGPFTGLLFVTMALPVQFLHPRPHWTLVEFTSARQGTPSHIQNGRIILSGCAMRLLPLRPGYTYMETIPLIPSTSLISKQHLFALQHSQHIFILERGCWPPVWCS